MYNSNDQITLVVNQISNELIDRLICSFFFASFFLKSMFDSIFILLIASLIFNSVKSQEIVLEKKHRISS